MFGQGHANKDESNIPDAAIDAAMNSGSPAPGGQTPAPTTDDSQPWQHPGQPLDSANQVTPPSTTVSPTVPSPSPQPSDNTENDSAHDQAVAPNDLLDIKQEALSKLSPLVGHLDQSPEEKFRTTMMMIQASDDQSKVRAAYDAALSIQDEKARAQALLDVINEINYFTQHKDNA